MIMNDIPEQRPGFSPLFNTVDEGVNYLSVHPIARYQEIAIHAKHAFRMEKSIIKASADLYRALMPTMRMMGWDKVMMGHRIKNNPRTVSIEQVLAEHAAMKIALRETNALLSANFDHLEFVNEQIAKNIEAITGQ